MVLFRQNKIRYSGFSDRSYLRNWGFLALAVFLIALSWFSYFFYKNTLSKNDLVLSGYVYSDDKPLIDATVFLGEKSALTDEDGFFIFQDLSFGYREITVSKEGFIAQRDKILIWKKENGVRDFKLVRDEMHNITFKGKVVNGFDKKPVEGAILELGSSNTTSDEQGGFEFKEMSAGDYVLKISAIGFADLDERVSLAKSESEKEYKITPYGKVSFTSSREGKKDIYTVSYDGSGIQNLTKDFPGDCWGARFSPDSDTFVFFSNMEEEKDEWGQSSTDLYFSEYKKSQQIGQDEKKKATAKKINRDLRVVGDYVLDKKGERVFFVGENQDGTERNIYFSGVGKNTEWVQLTSNDLNEISFSVSEDNKLVAFSAYFDGARDIYLLSTVDYIAKRISSGSDAEKFIRFLPGGKEIFYVKESVDGWTRFFVYDINKGIEKEVYKTSSETSGYVFSPKMDKLAFVSERDNAKNIYTIGVDGKNEIKLTEKSGEYKNLLWPELEKILIFENQKSEGNFLSVMDISSREVFEIETMSDDIMSWVSEGDIDKEKSIL